MIVECGLYRDGRRVGGRLTLEEAHGHRADLDGSFVWVAMDDPGDEQLDAVRDTLDIPAEAITAVAVRRDRSRLQRHDGGAITMVMHTARYDEANETVDFGQVGLIVTSTAVVAVVLGDVDRIGQLTAQLDSEPRATRVGPAGALAALVGAALDGYPDVLDGIADDIGEVEAAVFDNPRTTPTERIYSLNRTVLELRRAIGPLREAVDRLGDGGRRLVDESAIALFIDLSDDAHRLWEQVQGHHDLLSSVLSANLTQVALRQNEDMRKMSAWAAILAVPTAIAGIYGMNFTHMPELDWKWGYPLVIVVIAGICVGLHRQFKRIGWL